MATTQRRIPVAMMQRRVRVSFFPDCCFLRRVAAIDAEKMILWMQENAEESNGKEKDQKEKGERENAAMTMIEGHERCYDNH